MTKQPSITEKIVVAYDYRNESGELLYQNCRFEPKAFRQRCPDGAGGWSWSLNGQRRVLYRLGDLLRAHDYSEPVFFVEGEKDCDNLWALGLISTTSGAAHSWRDEFAEFLNDRQVIIIPDNDTPGKNFANRVKAALQMVNCPSVVILNLPGLPSKGDVSDWLQNGGTKEKLLVLAKEKQSQSQSPLIFTSLDSVTSKNVTWFWSNRIPAYMFSMLVGNPGIGKSFLTMYITAQITTGRDWPDSLNLIDPGSVLLFSDEESLEYVIKPRLSAHGADCSKVFAFNSLELTDKAGQFTIEHSLPYLEAHLDNLPDCRLIIFDPLTAYLGNVNANANAEVRGVLLGLQQLAQRRKITVLGVSHFSKKNDLEAIYRTLGSTAFTAAARSVWAVVMEKTEDEDHRPQRLLLPVKSNYSIDADGLAFNIIDGQVAFSTEPITQDIDKVMQGGHVASQKQDAMVWLERRLGNDTVLTSDILAESKQAGISYATIQRAANDLGIIKRRSPMHNNKYVWSMRRD